MLKRYLCILVCLFMISSVGASVFAQSGSPLTLSASYVKFSAQQEGEALLTFPSPETMVFATAKITNNGEMPQAAVFWVGLYKNEVLKDIEYQRKVIPAGVTYTFTTPAITVPAGATSENTQIKAYVWDNFTNANAISGYANMLKDSGELRYISIDGTLLQDFNNAKTSYSYVVPADVSKRPIIAAVPTDNATKVEISSYSVPGKANIHVTKGDGTLRTYTIDMKFGPGKITSLKNNLSTKTYRAFDNLQPLSLAGLRDVYTKEKNSWENYCRAYVDRSLNTMGAAIVDQASASAGDKIPSTSVPLQSGKSGDYLDYYQKGSSSYFSMWIATGTSAGDTSDIFKGASWIATANDDKTAAYMLADNPDAITFNIDRGATVWVAVQPSKSSANFINNGWNLSSEYKILHGDGTSGLFQAFFTKYFDAGKVSIPSIGSSFSMYRMYMPLIIWDAPSGYENADIGAIAYKMPGAEEYTALEGVSAGVDSYNITIPAAAAADGIPKLQITPTDQRSQVDVVYPQSVPGTSAMITITSVSGVQRQYTVNFVVDHANQQLSAVRSLKTPIIQNILNLFRW